MDLQIIKTEKEYESLLDWVDNQLDLNIVPETKTGQDLKTALLLIKQYEDQHYAYCDWLDPVWVDWKRGTCLEDEGCGLTYALGYAYVGKCSDDDAEIVRRTPENDDHERIECEHRASESPALTW